MKKKFNAIIRNGKSSNNYEEIREFIKELFKIKGEELTNDELERTMRAYIYLTDDSIPAGILFPKKDFEQH